MDLDTDFQGVDVLPHCIQNPSILKKKKKEST